MKLIALHAIRKVCIMRNIISVAIGVLAGTLLPSCANSLSLSDKKDRADSHMPNHEIQNEKMTSISIPSSAKISEDEFQRLVAGKIFKYKEIGSGIEISTPKEIFYNDGTYVIRGTRRDYHGKYGFKDGVIKIVSQEKFLGLENNRIFFFYNENIYFSESNSLERVFLLTPNN